MKAGNVQQGDTVRLVFNGGPHPFPQSGAYIDDVIVRHVPCDVGDWWHFEHEGETYQINPVASNFIGLKRVGPDREPF